MIKFNNMSQEPPYEVFKNLYKKSLRKNQKNIEAICIASYSKKDKEAHARYVNLKFVNGKEFIFFTNYNSPKANDFLDHDQITGLIYWNSINVQIRIKGYIKKTSQDFNQAYFAKRNIKKNALAISSNQSSVIGSYDEIKDSFIRTLREANLTQCPKYWGGYFFLPYYFEFWEGHEDRINKRKVFEQTDSGWNEFFLEP